MGKIYYLEKTKTEARILSLKKKQSSALKNKDSVKLTFMQRLRCGKLGVLTSIVVSMVIILIMVPMVPSAKALYIGSLLSAALLFWYTKKEGSPAIKECFMLIGAGTVVMALSIKVPYSSIQIGAGTFVAAIIIASLVYWYINGGKEEIHSKK